MGLSLFGMLACAILLQTHDPSLAKTASSIRTIDINDADFRDLAALESSLAGVQVVTLGEESHGDGATFLAKARLIRFLHERLGFDILAWESGFLDCEQLTGTGSNKGVSPEIALPNVWSDSAQVKPLFNYIVQTQKTAHPLRQTGFDIQSSSHKWLTRLVPFETPEEQVSIREWFAAGQREYGRPEVKRLLEGLVTRLRESTDADAELLAQTLRDLIAFEFRPKDASSDYRDRHMGENLVWLANTRYRGKKIVVWAANFHIARNIEPNYTSMGDVAFRILGKRIYSIGFTAYSGQVGSQNRANLRMLPPAKADNLEAMLHSRGAAFAFLDFRSLPATHWLREPIDAWPVRYEVMRLDWTSRFDGLFFVDQMTPSTF